MMHFCSKCNFETRQYSKLISHYRFVHSHDRGFFLTCNTDGCQGQYSNIDSFLKHIKRKHKIFYDNNVARLARFNREPSVLRNLFEVNVDDGIDDHENDGDEQTNHADTTVDFRKKLALFLLSMREKFKLPSSVLPYFVDEFSTQVGHHQAQVSQSVVRFCVENGFNEIQLQSLKTVLQTLSDVEIAFSSLNSEFKLNKYAKDELDFISPVEYKPDRHSADTYQYVPILETLKSLLRFDDVFSHVLHGHRSTDGHLGDFCDGEYFKTNPLFQSDPTSLQIMLYFDEFTAVNPIGHQVKNYKIGAFYMLLGNLPPKHRSQLYMIQLVMLCLSSSIKRYGFRSVLEPLLHDLSILEGDGITISKPDKDYTFKGTLSVVVSDNLGAHGIGGFMESFNTLRNCRHCFISKRNMATTFQSHQLPMRSIEMYDEQARITERNKQLCNVYGIKQNSPLNELQFYHVIKGLPADIAHDLFEGVACEIMKHVVKHCVENTFFSLEELNEEITSFEFSNIDKSNRPSKVSQVLRNLKIRQSASQMWCFIRFLPLLVGEKVPVGDPKWEVLLQLRDILFYVCAPVLHTGHTLVLMDLIEEFLQSFLTNFPTESLKPKFHYLLHYPKLINLFGPLIHQQTIRFEGKHNYFKELVYRTKNRKNICRSLALRHQYYQCTFNSSRNLLENEKIETRKGNTVPLCLLRDEFQMLLQPLLGDEVEVYVSRSMSVFGVSYSTGSCVVTGSRGYLYDFCKIVHCAVIHVKPYLLCSKLRTVHFDRHLHAYVVELSNDFSVIPISELKDPHPLGIYIYRNQEPMSLVVMSYKVLF